MVGGPPSREHVLSSRGRVLMQLWRFLELTRDIERNDEDTRFARSDGRIDYVLDENVFETLIDPVRNARFVRLFHSNAMDLPLEQAERDSISAQSALVTAELLLHGRLPGQDDSKPLYLTEWHYTELSMRFFDLAEEAKQGLQNGQHSRSAGHRRDWTDPLTRQDAQEFLDRAGSNRSAAANQEERFREVRRMARSMVEERWLQVMVQLRQLGSKSLTGRITPLTEPAEFRPTSQEAREIQNNAEHWKRRLEEAIQRRAGASFSSRSVGALDNDARTLAQVLWIATHRQDDKRRCVLVTGDRLIFDAYRRWYVEQPPWTPFLLRRVSQYAPIINFNDAASDVALSAQTLFVRTREAVEAAVLAFGLPRPNADFESRRSIARGREYLALALSERSDDNDDPAMSDKVIEFFAPQLNHNWILARQRDFDELKQNWAKVERFAIGVNHLLVSGRWNRGQEVAAPSTGQDTSAEGTESYARYLQDMMRALAKSGITLFFPLAAQYIRDAARDGVDKPYLRVPLTVRLHLHAQSHTGAETEDVGELISRWLTGKAEGALGPLDPANNAALAERPSFVFAVASAVALRLGSWHEAERFSNIAVAGSSALRDAERDEPTTQDDYHELLYLSAVAKRFCLGAQSPGRSGALRNVWAEFRASAVDRLGDCALHHEGRGEYLRASRAVSERAAVRLFYVAWAALRTPEVMQRRNLDFSDAKQEFEHAVRDLEKCLFELEPKAKQRLVGAAPSRIKSHDQIKLQYLINTAAAGALGHLLGLQLGEGPISLPPRLAAELQDRLDGLHKQAEEQVFMVADVLAYRALCLRQDRAREQLLILVRSATRQRLAIDQELLVGFASHLATTSPRASAVFP